MLLRYLFSIFIYALGGSIFSVGLMLWVYESSGSIAQFAQLGFFMMLSSLIALPFLPKVGALMERYNPKFSVQIFRLCLIALSVMQYFILKAQMNFYFLILILVIHGVGGALLGPASKSIQMSFATSKNYERVNGLIKASYFSATLIAPILAGFLLKPLGIANLALIQLGCALLAFLCCIDWLWAKNSNSSPVATTPSVSFLGGFKILRSHPIFAYAIFALIANIFAGIANKIILPVSIDLFSSEITGLLIGLLTAGSLGRSFIISAIGNVKRKVRAVLLLTLSQGFVLIIAFVLVLTKILPINFWAIVPFLILCSILEVIVDAIDLAYWQACAPEAQKTTFLSWHSMSALLSGFLAWILITPIVDGAKTLGKHFYPDMSANHDYILFFAIIFLAVANVVAVLVFWGFKHKTPH
ncbi:MFS transporter [Helicobacter labacensis]|uniref:MFS transporter n=1 Tax=Helicobacter labacensis TaxID=2316079 RepID=UPI000EB58769|nr:MFS transporter [Helicobacter labacensis]